MGGLARLVSGSAGVGGARRRARQFWSPAYPAFGLLFCPHPPAPLPGGKGETLGYFMQGAPPLASPAFNPLRHLLALPLWCPAGRLNPGGTCSPCPGGEDHLKRRSSSPPVPPLLGCRHCPEKSVSYRFCGEIRVQPPAGTVAAGSVSAARVQPPGACSAGSVSAAGGLMPGCRGRSPRRNKLKVPPSPWGKGVGGMGARNQAKGRSDGRQRRQAPPCRHHSGRDSQCRRGSAPRRIPRRQEL